jgi:uncharacterized RDD family membrane protein YckC
LVETHYESAEPMTNPYAPPQAVVLDVIDPAAGIQLADRSARLGAALLDGLILGFMVYLPVVVGALIDGITPSDTNQGLPAGLGIGLLLGAVGLVIWLWLTIKCLKANGQSIGKKAVHIKIVRTDGSPVSLARVIWLRNVVNALLGIIPLYGFIDPLFIFGNARRCVHDHLADTIVIKA